MLAGAEQGRGGAREKVEGAAGPHGKRESSAASGRFRPRMQSCSRLGLPSLGLSFLSWTQRMDCLWPGRESGGRWRKRVLQALADCQSPPCRYSGDAGGTLRGKKGTAGCRTESQVSARTAKIPPAPPRRCPPCPPPLQPDTHPRRMSFLGLR